MSCPADEQLTVAAAGGLEEFEAAGVREHLDKCPACRARFAELRRDDAELVRTYEAFDRDHDQLREQLMASLPATVPAPAPAGVLGRGWRWLGDAAMNNRKVRRAAGLLVPAACVVIAVTLLWNGESGTAFAKVIERMQEMSTMVCRVGSTITQAGVDITVDGTMYMSSEHGTMVEMQMGGLPIGKFYHPLEGPIITVNPLMKTYFEIGMSEGEDDNEAAYRVQGVVQRQSDLQGSLDDRHPDAYLKKLMSLTDDAVRSLGTRVIDGRKAEGFEIDTIQLGLIDPTGDDAGPSEIGETADGPHSAAHLWVDLDTGLPISFVIETAGPMPGSRMQIVHEDFEWNTPIDPELFTPVIPEGYKAFNLQMPAGNEETLIEALRISVEMADKYPDSLGLQGIGQLAGAAAAKKGGLTDPNSTAMQEIAQQVMLIGKAAEFHMQLVRDGHEPEYFGDQVEPGDADAVLMRWKLDDGSTRVIYGDLTADTVPAEQ